MADSKSTRRYQACEHVSEVSNYCEACNIFVCDDCSKEHLEHIESVCAWDSEVKEFLQLWKNCQSRCRVLLKTKVDEEKLRKELFAKIDAKFDNMQKTLEGLKPKMMSGVWGNVDPKTLSGGPPAPLDKHLDDINKVELEIEAAMKKKDPSAVLALLQQNKGFGDIQKGVEGYTSTKQNMLTLASDINAFKIKDNANHERIEGMVSYGAPFLKGPSENYFFPTKLWTRGTGPATMCDPIPLPAFFKITIKKTKGLPGIFGVARTSFKERAVDLGSKIDGEFAIESDGSIVTEGKKVKGNAPILNEDTLVIIHDHKFTLSFTYGGKQQPKDFVKAEGPFFLAATLPTKEAMIQILKIEKL